jgi:hypothetical protein
VDPPLRSAPNSALVDELFPVPRGGGPKPVRSPDSENNDRLMKMAPGGSPGMVVECVSPATYEI